MRALDVLEEALDRLVNRYKRILRPLKYPLITLLIWLLLSLPPLWLFLVGLLAKMSERILEELVDGREPEPNLKIDDLLEGVGYAFLLLPIVLLWCSPVLMSTLCVFYGFIRAGSEVKAVAISLLIAMFVVPMVLALQLIALMIMPISVFRFIEERDYRYALWIGELIADFDVMRSHLWNTFVSFTVDVALSWGLLWVVLIPLALALPLWLWLIIVFLSFTFSVSLALINALINFSVSYSEEFLRMSL